MTVDLVQAMRDYGEIAASYDRATRRIDKIRLRALALLNLAPGDTVLDAGCGTGWCIPFLSHAVGAQGLVIAFDPSAQMVAVARQRVAQARLDNALLVQARGCDIRLSQPPAAVLFSYTHDLLQSRRSLEHVLGQCPAQARVVACGTKRFPSLLWPLNVYQRRSHRHYISDFDGLKQPWQTLSDYLDGIGVDLVFPGNKYLVWGRIARRFCLSDRAIPREAPYVACAIQSE